MNYLIVYFAVLLLFISGCTIPDASKDNFKIVLITIDTLRADHLSSYGYERNTSPTIDKLANKGIIFRNSISSSSWTTPAMVSLFTSTYPINHGVVNGFGYKGEELMYKQEVFSDDLITLAEILKANGYTTFGVASNLHLYEKFGFAKGFDFFKSLPCLSAPAVNKSVFLWKDAIKKSGKIFLWVHYFDPHYPYSARNPWFGQYVSQEKIPKIFKTDRELASMDPMELTARMYKLKQSSAEQSAMRARQLRENLIARYDSEINYVDSYVGKLIKKLDLDKNSLFIITSDHGEEFFEHTVLGHGYNLYQKSIRIPLIITLPHNSESKIVEKDVSIVDIMPTILDILKIDCPDHIVGKSLLQRSKSEYNFTEIDIFSNSKAIITSEWKYIYNYKDKSEQLFNLKADPLELNNYIDRDPMQGKLLKSRLFEWVSTAKKYPPTRHQAKLTPEEKEKLKALGYVR